MTSNKTEVKRYNITTDKYDHPVPYESEHGQWVKYSSYEALQTECKELRSALAESRSNDLTAMGYLSQVRGIVGGDDFPDMVRKCEVLRKDAEFGRSVLSKREPGKVYGCHCDLEEGMEPDGCVIDSNERHDCLYAAHIEVKEQCKYWKIIATDIDTAEESK